MRYRVLGDLQIMPQRVVEPLKFIVDTLGTGGTTGSQRTELTIKFYGVQTTYHAIYTEVITGKCPERLSSLRR